MAPYTMELTNPTMRRLYLALALSLLFHLSQMVAIRYIPATGFNFDTPTEIELVEEAPLEKNKALHEKPILAVPKPTVPAIINDDPAQFFSEQTQRVEKQTRVENYGVHNNNGAQSAQSAQSTQAQPQKNLQNNTADTTNNEPEFAKAVRQPRLQVQGTSSSASAMEYKLPNDISIGDMTNLNTDAHIHASFYNRVVELFYIRWAQRLDAIWSRLPAETKQKLSGNVWRTDVEIWLRANGEYDRGMIMKPSGYATFDQAGIYAFQNARVFPNPPPEKVESDGYIRLRYRIGVYVR